MGVLGNPYAYNNLQALQDSIEKDLDIGEVKFDMFYTIFALPSIFARYLYHWVPDRFHGGKNQNYHFVFGCNNLPNCDRFRGSLSQLFNHADWADALRYCIGKFVTAQAAFVSFWFKGK